MSDEKLKMEEREIAASGLPAPTVQEAQHELHILEDLLANHGCPTTRDLIGAAAIVVDVAHRDAHAEGEENVNSTAPQFFLEKFLPLRAELEAKGSSFPTELERAHWFARFAHILLYWARESAIRAVIEAKASTIPPAADVAELTQDEQQKLLDMLTTSKWKN